MDETGVSRLSQASLSQPILNGGPGLNAITAVALARNDGRENQIEMAIALTWRFDTP